MNAYLATCLIAMALSGCAREDSTHSLPNAADQAAATKAAELQAREQQLAQRETEVKGKEAEQEQLRQAEAAAAEREAARAAAAKEAKQAAARAATRRAAEARAASTPAAGRATPPPVATSAPLSIPAGTQLVVALATDVSTKTATVGESFEARLTSPLMSGDRVVAASGARVSGTITEVVSGSNRIGAVPALGMRFDRLDLSDGRQVSIRGELQQMGASEKGSDAAKIVGGAAAGAVIGHQIKHGNTGKVIGGILGGAAGAMVARNTGTEVQLPAGSQLTIVLDEGFVVASR